MPFVSPLMPVPLYSIIAFTQEEVEKENRGGGQPAKLDSPGKKMAAKMEWVCALKTIDVVR